jgi:hypothetical protein
MEWMWFRHEEGNNPKKKISNMKLKRKCSRGRFHCRWKKHGKNDVT